MGFGLGTKNINLDNQHFKSESFDEFLVQIEDGLKKVRDSVLIDKERVRQMFFSYSVLKFILRNQDVVIDYKVCISENAVGVITVIGDALKFCNDAEWFARASEFASSTAICPYLWNDVKMTLTFCGITKFINRVEDV